jgi:hypothetical protein
LLTQDVEPAELAAGKGDHVGDLFALGHVGRVVAHRTPQEASRSARVRSISAGSPRPFSTTSQPRIARARGQGLTDA